MHIIDGRALAQTIREDVTQRILAHSTPPRLGVLLVGEDPASHLYVKLKEKAAQEVGIQTDIRRLSAAVTDEELIAVIESWNTDPNVNAILVQLPLPEGHDTDRVIEAIDPVKDVDGFHPKNIQALEEGTATIFSPVHEAVLRLIAATGFDPRNKSASVIANSDTFAHPLELLLRKAGFVTTTIYPDHLDTEILRTSDVIVTAVGRPGFIKADLVRPGTILIDVGTAKDEYGKTRGDVDAASVEPLDGWMTPVPGGVGPMTVALLLLNVERLASQSQ